MGRLALVLITGFAVIFGTLKLRVGQAGSQAVQTGSARYEAVSAQALANSAAALCLSQLKQDRAWRAGYSNQTLGSGAVSASVMGTDTVTIIATGTCGQKSATVSVRASLGAVSWPANVNAGITARANVETAGNMIVDGRDHDWNGNLIANLGVKGIVTVQDCNRSGNSRIGGTVLGVDVAPTKFGWELVVSEGIPWPSGYPTTPDLVLGGAAAGFSEGTLKATAQSGVLGSQYVTNPADLDYPLSGVTYVELPSGSVWNPAFFSDDCKGILVVHNDACNAVIKNLNSGTFRGLIIADDVVHIHNTIIGALFTLTPGPSEGKLIGNGNGRLLFCRQAINRGMQESGSGRTSVSILEYYE
ncbi:MAG: hypothetical protein C4534_00495 [Gaiellales bacterium]|nr:MAG: hypothetical protein C4534_00495 [Gaiellales bacterium]